MIFRFKVHSSKFFLLLLAFSTASCGLSIPNLEQPECTEARNEVREFYSYHFGNDMKPLAENLQKREKFLSAELKQQLEQQLESTKDYFTQADDYPKAFRVGACEVVSPEKTIFEVLLFWKDNTRSEQREIKVEMIKQNNNWLINQVKL